MTGVAWGLVATLAPTVVACFVMLHRAHQVIAAKNLALAAADWRIANLEDTLKAERAVTEQTFEDIRTRLRRLAQQRDEATDKGGRAAVVVLHQIAAERSQHAQSITDERLDFAAERERYAALVAALWGIVSRAPRALPPAPNPPLALPSGHFLAGRDLLQPDDLEAGFDYWAVESVERMPSREAVSP